MSQPATVIHIQRLTKAFGKVRALDGLDLTVHPGEVHGFLGPNGAGKSTTIRILLGLIRATGGHVELFGADFRCKNFYIKKFEFRGMAQTG